MRSLNQTRSPFTQVFSLRQHFSMLHNSKNKPAILPQQDDCFTPLFHRWPEA
jgi:hypothetical protein